MLHSLLFWSNLGEMCPLWGTPSAGYCLVLQRLRLDKQRHSNLRARIKPPRNSGVARWHCDNTKWLVSPLFIHPRSSRIAPFPNLIHSSWAREDALRVTLGLLSILSPATDRDTDAPRRRAECVSKNIQQSDRALRWYCTPIQ